MFKDHTVFVVGAGASAEFGLPVGSGLMTKIKENCSFELEYGSLTRGPEPIFNHYQRIYGMTDPDKVAEFNKRLTASRQIRDGIESADSIDEYIFRYSEDSIIAEVGKLQIAYAISKAEAGSILSYKNGFAVALENAHETWIWPFTKALFSGIKANEIERIGKNITIICFNYDRCIEHYLEHAISRSFYGVSIQQAREIVKNINIIHPYGKLGELDEIPFGAAEKFAQSAENLITWSETIRDQDTINDMKAAIMSANQLVFMGFAFANQNMQLLNGGPNASTSINPLVYSTGFGLRRETEQSLSRNIIGLYSSAYLDSYYKRIHFQYDAKCKEFFNIHRLNLVQ